MMRMNTSRVNLRSHPLTMSTRWGYCAPSASCVYLPRDAPSRCRSNSRLFSARIRTTPPTTCASAEKERILGASEETGMRREDAWEEGGIPAGSKRKSAWRSRRERKCDLRREATRRRERGARKRGPSTWEKHLGKLQPNGLQIQTEDWETWENRSIRVDRNTEALCSCSHGTSLRSRRRCVPRCT